MPPVKPSHQVKARRKTTPAIALASTRTLDPTGQCSSIAAERDALKKALAFSKKINREPQQATESRHARPSHAIESQLLAKNSEIAALKKALLAVKAQHKAQIDELTLALENSRNKIDSLQSRLAAGTHSTDKNGEAARATSAQESKIQKLLAALALSQHKLHQQERLLASRSTSKPDEREKTAALVGKIAVLTANASQKEKELSQTRQALAASQTNVDKLRQQLVAITQKFNAMRQSDTRALE